MITYKQLISEFKKEPPSKSGGGDSGKPKVEYKLYDWGDKQVYNEAGTFTTPHLAFTKLNQLYKRDPDAFGDLGVIKYEGNVVYSIHQEGNKFIKSKIG